jgi:tetratricopeptide (TPR) repeat protein
MVQLSLFSAERLKVGEGFDALSELDLVRAAALFDEVLDKNPDVSDARSGRAAVAYWQRIMKQMQALDGPEKPELLWQRIKEARPDPLLLSERLKQSLIEWLIELLHEHGVIFVPPDLCAGYLYLEIGHYRHAVSSLREALERYPDSARLRGFLGDALWCLGRESWARAEYARALLVSARDLSLDDLRDRQLLDIIAHHGLSLAPVHGWLNGVLPLLDPDELTINDTQIAAVYRHFYAAEQARKAGDIDAAVRYRQLLQQVSPELFDAYMARLA